MNFYILCFHISYVLYSQSYSLSCSHVQMRQLGHKEGCTSNNWSFRIVVLEKTLESPLDCKEIQPVHPKGNQSWIFIGRTDAEAEAPIIWPPDSLEKTLVLGNTEGTRKKGWKRMRWLDSTSSSGHEFEQTLGDSEGQWNLVCCSPWGHKELDMT